MVDIPAVARELKQGLVRLSKGAAGPELAEMAQEILEGRTDLRAVGRSSAYGEQFAEAVGRFQQWYTELTPDERKVFVEESRAKFGVTGADE